MKLAVLKPGKEKKVLNYYQWVYQDDIAEMMGSPETGEIINILDSRHTFIAKAFYNPLSNIPVRIISLEDLPAEKIIESKISAALSKRADTRYGRLFFAEGDLLPGLIVDRYGEYLVIQIRNPGLYRFKELILELYLKHHNYKGLILRNDFETLRDGGLVRENEILSGSIPDELIIEENGFRFYVDLLKGQKTGYFYDQRDNRKKILDKITAGSKGLDLYTYTGSFAIHAASRGAFITGVDKSRPDLDLAEKNARLNSVSDQIQWVQGEVLPFLKAQTESFDFIICDPPGMAKRKNELKGIQKHLVDINIEMLRLLTPGGWLVLFSCSHIMAESFMKECLSIAAFHARRPVYFEETTHQPHDHPALLQMPETGYLTGVWIKGE